MDHRANVCKLEVRSCEFSENGCQFKVSILWLFPLLCYCVLVHALHFKYFKRF